MTHKNVVKYYSKITLEISKNRLKPFEIIEYLKRFNFSLTNNVHEIIDTPKHHRIIERGFEVIIVGKTYYLHILTPRFRLLMKDDFNTVEKSYVTEIVVFIMSILLIIVYLLILKNIKNTKLFLNSRQLFLRTVMHELKTPIAKGRIVSELIDDEKQKKRMSIIFEKLDFLINDFAKVEEVVSKQYSLNKNKYTINTLCEHSITMLMLDSIDDKIILKFNCEEKVTVDLELFSMAIKNLLDNALKYSTDKKVIIEYTDNKLNIISSGKKLNKPLEDYYKPFHNDTHSKNHGMGLGLYMVYSILSLHNKELSYKNINNQNIFSINLNI